MRKSWIVLLPMLLAMGCVALPAGPTTARLTFSDGTSDTVTIQQLDVASPEENIARGSQDILFGLTTGNWLKAVVGLSVLGAGLGARLLKSKDKQIKAVVLGVEEKTEKDSDIRAEITKMSSALGVRGSLEKTVHALTGE